MSETWKLRTGGGDDGGARFGGKARAWLRRRIRAQLFVDNLEDPECPFKAKKDGVYWDQWAVDLLLDWYLQRPMSYVRWADTDEYRGRGFSHGAWVFVGKSVEGDRDAAVTLVDQEIDADNFKTLDAWLKADLNGHLNYVGAPSGMVRVAQENRQPNKRKCQCGERFVMTRRNARHCPKCIAGSRQERATKRAARQRPR